MMRGLRVRVSPGARFCPSSAAAVDATSAETAVLAQAAGGWVTAPRLTTSSSVDEGRFLPGVVLAGRYRIGRTARTRRQGEVYRATDLTLGQAVALTFLPEAAARDERALARFCNEVRMALTGQTKRLLASVRENARMLTEEAGCHLLPAGKNGSFPPPSRTCLQVVLGQFSRAK